MKVHPIALNKKLSGIVVVTGCDSDVGKSLVLVLLQMGYTVVQSYFEENAFLNNPNVYSRQLDLRKPDELKSFVFLPKKFAVKEKSWKESKKIAIPF